MTTIVYDRPKEYCKSWVELIGVGEQYAVDAEVIHQMSQLSYFDVADQQHLLRWMDVIRQVRGMAFQMHNDPKTENIVQAELTAQLTRVVNR